MKQMKNTVLLAVIVSCLCLNSPSASAQQLSGNFEAHLRDLQNSAQQVGIQVASLPNGGIVYEYRAKETLVPASLVKLLTSYSALKQMGPHHRFLTSVWSVDEPYKGVLHGSIWVKSEGDIFLDEKEVQAIACKLRELGVRRVEGGIYVDNTYFDPGAQQICLDGNCASSYNPVVSATALDFNTIVFRVDPGDRVGDPVRVTWLPSCDYVQLTNLATTGGKRSRTRISVQSQGTTQDGRERFHVAGRLPLRSVGQFECRVNTHAPAGYFARSFKMMLQQTGCEVLKDFAGEAPVPKGARQLLAYESPPLEDLLYGLNRYSNNFMAEMLLRSLGSHGMGMPGSVDKGVTVMKRSLLALGVSDREVLLDSGSGLSRECRASANAFCRVLLGAYQDSSIGPGFLSSMAVNGEDGTLKNRMHRSDVVVRGKTGTLSNVVGFAGYVGEIGKEPYVAVVLLNGVQNVWKARQAMDSFLLDVPFFASARGTIVPVK